MGKLSNLVASISAVSLRKCLSDLCRHGEVKTVYQQVSETLPMLVQTSLGFNFSAHS